MIFNQKKWFSNNIIKIQDGMYRVAYGILHNEMDAQDAIQESIYKAYKNLDSLEDEKKFKSWIYKILTNTSLEMLKNRKVHIDIEENEIEDTKTKDFDTKLSLWEVVQKLKEPYKTVIILFYYEDMSIKEICNITNSKEDAVKKQLSRGRDRIKEVIKL